MKHIFRSYPNGLRLIINKSETQATSILFHISGGVAQERKKEEGFTYLIKNALALGTEKYKSCEDLNSYIKKLGGSFSCDIFPDSLEISIKTIASSANDMINFLSQIVFHSLFDESKLKDLAQSQMQEIKNQSKNHNLLCYDKLRAVSFANSGLDNNILGRKSVLLKITRTDIIEFWKSMLSPDNIIISVSGNVDVDSLYESVFKNFYNELLLIDGKSFNVNNIKPDKIDKRISIVNKKLNQSRVCLGFYLKDFEKYNKHHYRILANIISEKLKSAFLNNKSAHYIDCNVRTFIKSGLFFVTLVFDKESFFECFDLVIDVLNKMKIDADIFSSNKNCYLTNYAFSGSSTNMLTRISARHLAEYGKVFELDNELENIQKINLSKCNAVFLSLKNCLPFLSFVGDNVDVDLLNKRLENLFK